MKYCSLLLLLTFTFFITANTVAADELRDTQCVEFEDAPDLSEEDQEAANLAYQAFKLREDQCKNTDGSFKYRKVTIQSEEGGSEELDCIAMAEQAYKMSMRNNCGQDRAGLMSCLTNGWDQRDVFDMFERIQSVDQALPGGEQPDPFASKLGMKLEEHFACPGKTEPDGALIKAIGCSLVSSVTSMVPLGQMSTDLIINHMIPEQERPDMRSCIDGENACLTQVVWGAVQNVVSNVQGIYELAKMAGRAVVNGAKYVGNQVVKGAQSAGRAIARGWNRLWGNDVVEDATADQHNVLAQVPNEVDEEELPEATGNVISRLIDGVMNSVKEGTLDQFSCSKWEGGVSGMGGLGGLANRVTSSVGVGGARCVEAAPSFECASAKQKVQMFCGVAGFIGGEIVTTLLTGGTVRAASIAGKAGARVLSNGGRVARATLAVGRGAMGLTRGVISGVGTGVSWVATTAAKGGRATGGIALKLGNKMLPIDKAMQMTMVQSAAAAAKAGVRAATFPVRKYINLLDEAYTLGRYGRDGAFALKTVSVATKADDVAAALEGGLMSKNLNRSNLLPDEGTFKAASEGQEAFAKLEDAQRAVQEAHEKFVESVKKARRGSNGANAENLAKEADEAFLAYQRAKNGLKPADQAYEQSLVQFREKLAREEAERLAAEEAARRAAQQQAEAQRIAATNSNSTALTTTSTNTSSSRALITQSDNTSTSVARVQNNSTPARNSNSATTVRSIADNTVPTPRIGSGASTADNYRTGNINYTTQEKSQLIDGFAGNLKVDNKTIRVTKNGSNNWDVQLRDARVEGDKLIGTNTYTNQLDEIDISEIGLVEVRGTARVPDGNGGMVDEIFAQPLSLSRSTNPQYESFMTRAADDTVTRTNDEIHGILHEMNSMPRAEAARIASVTTYKLSNRIMPTEMEFLASIKNSGGYITKPKLPHIEKFREMYRTIQNGSADDALAMLDDIYRGTRSEATALIRNNIAMRTRAMGMIRAQTQLVTTARIGAETNDLRLNAQRGLDGPSQRLIEGPVPPLRIAQGSDNLLPVVRATDDLVPPPSVLTLADEFPVPVLARTTRASVATTGSRVARTVSAAALITDAVTNNNSTRTEPTNLPEIVVIGTRRNTSTEYRLSGSYVAGPPARCIAYIKKLNSENEAGDPLDAAGLSAEGVTMKWFTEDSEAEENLVCEGSTERCDMPEGKKLLWVFAYKDGTKFSSLQCSAPEDNRPRDPEVVTPYDVPTGDSNIGDTSKADEFFERERSPPPNLFQPVSIPPRPTHYLHGGWY
tara:strand:+ start:2049 stop:5897 length:3849 start_codon:yes stop_codon:yes gene_type:complete